MIELIRGRKLRLSPLYCRYEKDAKLAQMMGYERPVYFEANADGDSYDITRGPERPDCEACEIFLILC